MCGRVMPYNVALGLRRSAVYEALERRLPEAVRDCVRVGS